MTAVVALAGNPRRQRRLTARRTRTAWLLLTPAIVLTSVFLVIPMAYAIWLSFRGSRVTGRGLGRRTEVFVGLDNFSNALTNPELWAGLGRLAIYGMITIPITLGLALLFALLLDLPTVRFARASRLIIFLPFAVPGIIASLNWGFIYLPGVSPIHYAARALGVQAPDLLGPHTVYLAMANIAIWGGIGFNMIVLYTALRTVPPEIYDAARIDGCNELKIALQVKIPLIIPGLVLTGLFSVIGTLQLFSEPTVLARLTNNVSTTWVPMMYVYRDAFVLNNIYSATATALILTVATVVVSLLLVRAVQNRAFQDNQ